MSTSQKRHLCAGCGREWIEPELSQLSGSQWLPRWTPGEPCPRCGHAEVTLITYQPAFRGADIPRQTVAPVAPVAAPPPIVPPDAQRGMTSGAETPMALAASHVDQASQVDRRPRRHDAIPEFG